MKGNKYLLHGENSMDTPMFKRLVREVIVDMETWSIVGEHRFLSSWFSTLCSTFLSSVIH